MYRVTRLPNGLRVATAEMPDRASVSLGLWVGIGSRYEPAEWNGACHFIEHMLFKGTRTRSARQISQAVEGIGGYLNAFTSEEMTCIHSRARADRFDDLLDVLADMFLRSEFAPAEVTREREVIKEEVAMGRDQPQNYVHELLNATAWPGHPLGRPITGTEQSLDRLTRARLRAYQGAHYLAGNTLVVVAGRLKHRQVVRAVSRHTRFFKRGALPRFAPVHEGQRRPRVSLCTRRTEQTQLALGIRTCSRHDGRRYALRLLNALLGENMSSRLFQVVREDRGLAYSIYSTLSFWDDAGDLVIAAGLDTDHLPETLRLILRELRRIAETPPGAAELRRARDYVIGQFDLSLDSVDNQMSWLAEQLLGYGKLTPAVEFKRRLSAVRPGEIRGVARDFFRSARSNLALVSPLKSGEKFATTLAAGLL